MMRPSRLALLLLAPLVLAARAAANQSPAVQTPTPPQSVFKSGVDLVRLDVQVVDEQGRPVKDLRADEVEVTEGGEVRPIVLLQHVAEPEGTYLEVARRTIGAEVSTNRGAPRGQLYVLVFDQGHITPGNEQKARLAAERFLRARVRPGDRVAVYALPGPGPQLPFTSNVSHAIAELLAVRGSLDRTAPVSIASMSLFEAYQITRGDLTALQQVATRSGSTAPATDLSAANPAKPAPATATADTGRVAEQLVRESAQAAVERADAETRAFLALLSDVIRDLSVIEGRKTVLLMSEGFFADNIGRDLELVAAAAAEAYAVVYAFDLNRRSAGLLAAEPAGADTYAEIQSRTEPLGSLAAETNGELVLDATSYLDRALEKISSVSRDYYVIGFEPPAGALDSRGRYRRVSIRLKRQGAKVIARTGYSVGQPVGSADRRRAIDMALAAPFPQQGLPLDLTTYVMRGRDGVHRVFMCLEAELPVAGDAKARPADVVFVAKSAWDGRVVASGTDTVALPQQPGDVQNPAKGVFRVQFEAPPGDYLMRAIVREPGGSTGSVDRRFTVRNFDGIDVTASDLVIGPRAAALPVRATAYADDVMAGLLEVYARDERVLEDVEVTVELVASGAERAVTSVRADLFGTRPGGTGASRIAQIALPLGGVPPGPYVARATVRARGETVAELTRDVDVRAGAAPAETPVLARPATPADILQGLLTRQLVDSVRTTSDDPAVVAGAELAALGQWAKVEAAAGRSQTADRPDAKILLGLAAFAAGRHREAATQLEGAIETGPARALVAFHLGWVEALSGDDLKAIAAWRQATVLDLTMISAYLALADAYLRLSQPALAVQVLSAGLERVPQSPELAAKLAEVRRR